MYLKKTKSKYPPSSSSSKLLKKKKKILKKKTSKSSSSKSKPIEKKTIIRCRGRIGTFRFEVSPNDTFSIIKHLISSKSSIPSEQIFLSLKPIELSGITNEIPKDKKKYLISIKKKINSVNLDLGNMVYFSYSKFLKSVQEEEDDKKRENKKKLIGDGKDVENLGLKFRKKQWTMTDYLNLVDKISIKIKRQIFSVVREVKLDERAGRLFRDYLIDTALSAQRYGLMFGSVYDYKLTDKDKSDFEDLNSGKKDINEDYTLHKSYGIKVEAIYEPKQEGSEEGFLLLNDSTLTKKAIPISKFCGLKPVGSIFSHQGGRDFPLTGNELILAAKNQLKYGEHFVTITVFPNEEGELQFEAFQVSKQCMELVKQNYLIEDPDDHEKVKTTKIVFEQRKKVKQLDTIFFITNAAIKQFQSKLFRTGFPPTNRYGKDYTQNDQALQRVYKARKQFPFVRRLADFHMLIYLTKHLSLSSDIPKICSAIVENNNSSIIGFEQLVEAYAGISNIF